jgi:hypothetical protein
LQLQALKQIVQEHHTVTHDGVLIVDWKSVDLSVVLPGRNHLSCQNKFGALKIAGELVLEYDPGKDTPHLMVYDLRRWDEKEVICKKIYIMV